jgi:hypothetical protein
VAQVPGYLISFGLCKRGLVVLVAACLLIFGATGLRNKPLFVILERSPLSLTAQTESSGRVSAQIVANVSIWNGSERRVQVHVAARNLDKKGINFAGDAVWSSPLTHLNSSTQGTGGFIDTLNHRFNIPHQVTITIARPFSQVMVTGTTTSVGNIAHVREDHQPPTRDAVFDGGPDTSKRLWRLSSSQRTTLHRGQPCFDG